MRIEATDRAPYLTKMRMVRPFVFKRDESWCSCPLASCTPSEMALARTSEDGGTSSTGVGAEKNMVGWGQGAHAVQQHASLASCPSRSSLPPLLASYTRVHRLLSWASSRERLCLLGDDYTMKQRITYSLHSGSGGDSGRRAQPHHSTREHRRCQ